MNRKNCAAALSAILAAVFYAINIPASKILLGNIEPVMMAAVLYLGAGIGVGIIYMARKPKEAAENSSLNRGDLPYVLGMILLDIAAPICLMYGLSATTAANASLLNNFEIAATAVIALAVFKEAVSARLWAGIALITVSSMILSFEDMSSLQFSWGSAFVLLAAVCWGFENNCTRKISSKNTYQIVMLKGIFSGLGSFVIALITGEALPDIGLMLIALVLGFVSYGLSIFFYIRAQSRLGAAKTSAYYAIAPFVGAFLSFVCLHEALSVNYFIALVIMLAGSALVAADTIIVNHTHMHTHIVTHTHDGSTHTHIFEHSHDHKHMIDGSIHEHTHSNEHNLLNHTETV